MKFAYYTLFVALVALSSCSKTRKLKDKIPLHDEFLTTNYLTISKLITDKYWLTSYPENSFFIKHYYIAKRKN